MLMPAAIESTNDRSMLGYAWLWFCAAAAAAAALFKTHGMRWIIFNSLPGWFPRLKQALDFMHCVFLGARRAKYTVR